MDILDVHIVRIKDHDTETDLSLDTYFPVDAESYPPVPKKMSWQSMITYIVRVIFSNKIYTEKGIRLIADTPYPVVFPVPFVTDYIIIPSFVHSESQTGLTITDETMSGFTITSNGEDCTLDITVIPITPLT
jgi:hypothetical protein